MSDWRSKSPLLNSLIKIEATVHWACYGGVSVRGIFMRDVWTRVKLGNVCDNAKNQVAAQALKKGIQLPWCDNGGGGLA